METAKIFGIGFHKTGTTSLHRALQILGYRAIHGDSRLAPPFGDEGRSLIQRIERGDPRLPTIARYDAFTDNPYFTIWKALDEAYPNSKFILTVRDEDAWIASCVRYYQGRRIRPMRSWMFGAHADPAESPESRAFWLDAYRNHNREVIEHFSNRHGDLLVLDITAGDGWDRLCPFLNQPIPRKPFPMANVTRSNHSSIMPNTVKSALKKAAKTFRIFLYHRIDQIIGRRDFYIVSHPKSGRTWLGVALGRVVERIFGLPHQALLKEYQYLLPHKPGLPRLIFAHLASRPLANGIINRPLHGKQLILLVRDPRDVVVSYFHQLTARKSLFQGNLSEFLRDAEFGIPKIVTYMNYFACHWDSFVSPLVIRYEDMKADMGTQLELLCHTVGLQPSPEVIADAVEWARFDNMQDRERNGYYHRKLSWLNPRDSANPDSFKSRKGRIGSHREELSPEDIAYLDDYINANLDDHFAYYKTIHQVKDEMHSQDEDRSQTSQDSADPR